MLYCESCHFVTEKDICPICGKKNLRQPNAEDDCLLTEQPEIWAKMLAEVLALNQVTCTMLPVRGAGVTMRTGGTERYRIYVSYATWDEAQKLKKFVLEQ